MKDNKRTLIIVLSIFILITAMALLILINVLFRVEKNKEDEDETTTTTTASLVDKTFRGYKTYELSDNDTYSYDYIKNYEFVFANKDPKDLNNEYKDKSYNYTISLENGELIFRESIENVDKNAYQETGITYQFGGDGNITSFLIPKGEEPTRYAILAMDDKSNLYVYEHDGKEKSITKIIASIKKIKTISNAFRVGYYNYSNVPAYKNKDFELIYQDVDDNIRYLTTKSTLFYDSAYYRTVGHALASDFIIVHKDGKMFFNYNDENALNNGNNNIIYRGSFYTYDDDSYEATFAQNIYIIGKDRYLYYIKDFNYTSLPILNKVSIKKVKRIGVQVVKDDDNFATSYNKILIEYEDGEQFKLDKISDFELLG